MKFIFEFFYFFFKNFFEIFLENFLSKILFLWENLDYFFLFWNQYRRFMISFDFRFD